MLVDFVRFQASDGVELYGWLTDVPGDTAVIHIHGMSGNGYEHIFLDRLHESYAELGISFFPIDSRGRGVISVFQKGKGTNRWGDGQKKAGSCYEIFEESTADIQGAIDFLKTRGKSRFILQGHSMGATKIVNYVLIKSSPQVVGLILLAPTDMVGWAETDPKHPQYLKRAHKLLKEGKPEELVSSSCWLDETPLSAQTYPAICEADTPADIYGNRKDGALLSRVALPMIIIYGDQDLGVIDVDGNASIWLKRVRPITHKNTQIAIIKGAPHSFRSYEEELAKLVRGFIRSKI